MGVWWRWWVVGVTGPPEAPCHCHLKSRWQQCKGRMYSVLLIFNRQLQGQLLINISSKWWLAQGHSLSAHEGVGSIDEVYLILTSCPIRYWENLKPCSYNVATPPLATYPKKMRLVYGRNICTLVTIAAEASKQPNYGINPSVHQQMNRYRKYVKNNKHNGILYNHNKEILSPATTWRRMSMMQNAIRHRKTQTT